MGLFSRFSKPAPEEVYRTVAQKIVAASLSYRLDLPAQNNKLSADVGAEVAYFLLHVVDREAFRLLGVARRDTVFDEIAKIVISDYARAVLTPNTPDDVLLKVAVQLMDTMNSRQSIYAQCKSLLGEPLPGHKGTMLFALCFFIHRALGETNRADVDDILTGERDVDDSDLNDFPDIQVIFETAVRIGTMLTNLRIPDDLKRLK
jgi:hypothetical protein